MDYNQDSCNKYYQMSIQQIFFLSWILVLTNFRRLLLWHDTWLDESSSEIFQNEKKRKWRNKVKKKKLLFCLLNKKKKMEKLKKKNKTIARKIIDGKKSKKKQNSWKLYFPWKKKKKKKKSKTLGWVLFKHDGSIFNFFFSSSIVHLHYR